MKLSKLIFLLPIFLFLCAAPAFSQNPADTWKLLADVKIKSKKDPKTGGEISYPVFGPKALKNKGQIIRIKGFMVPLDELRGKNFFVLSALPFNMCYFCGGAGPETVMEIYTKKPMKYTAKTVTLSGRLKLNAEDPDHLMYILEEAVLDN